MTIDQFAEMAKTRRIPTPAEFKAFAEGQGFKIARNGEGTPVLRVKDKTDPMARALARMLGREPWRSEVIKLAEGGPAPIPQVAPPPELQTAAVSVARVIAEASEDPADREQRLVRSGTCRARADGWLAWANYAGGGVYRFEELVIPNGRQHVTSFRVFAGESSGYAGRTNFAEMFEEEPHGARTTPAQ